MSEFPLTYRSELIDKDSILSTIQCRVGSDWFGFTDRVFYKHKPYYSTRRSADPPCIRCVVCLLISLLNYVALFRVLASPSYIRGSWRMPYTSTTWLRYAVFGFTAVCIMLETTHVVLPHRSHG